MEMNGELEPLEVKPISKKDFWKCRFQSILLVYNELADKFPCVLSRLAY